MRATPESCGKMMREYDFYCGEVKRKYDYLCVQGGHGFGMDTLYFSYSLYTVH